MMDTGSTVSVLLGHNISEWRAAATDVTPNRFDFKFA